VKDEQVGLLGSVEGLVGFDGGKFILIIYFVVAVPPTMECCTTDPYEDDKWLGSSRKLFCQVTATEENG
jgi:hypothetical protein